MLLKDKIAVVTGAGSGIGRVISVAFAREGAHVVLVGRRLEKLEETAALCSGAGPLLVRADIGDEDEVNLLQRRVQAQFERCDVLVNNAGIFKPAPGTLLHETPIPDWDEVLRINVRGPFLCLRAFAPGMIARNYGRIINVTSGLKHSAGHGAYSVSKSALDSLTKTAAHELAPYNVLVNALNPGWVRTEMAQSAPDDPEQVVPLALQLATLPNDEPSGVEYHV